MTLNSNNNSVKRRGDSIWRSVDQDQRGKFNTQLRYGSIPSTPHPRACASHFPRTRRTLPYPVPVPAKFPGVGALVLVDRGKGRGNAGILVGGIPIIPSRARDCRPPDPALGVGGSLYMWHLACMHFKSLALVNSPRCTTLGPRPPRWAIQCKPADIAGGGLDWPPVICTWRPGIAIARYRKGLVIGNIGPHILMKER